MCAAESTKSSWDRARKILLHELCKGFETPQALCNAMELAPTTCVLSSALRGYLVLPLRNYYEVQEIALRHAHSLSFGTASREVRTRVERRFEKADECGSVCSAQLPGYCYGPCCSVSKLAKRTVPQSNNAKSAIS